MIYYPNRYQHALGFKDKLYKSVLDDAIVQKQIQTVVTRLNAYYYNATNGQVSCKKYFEITFGHGQMLIILETENPLPNPKRIGNCMRQFSRFLLTAGFDQYLTSPDYGPQKLLSARREVYDKRNSHASGT